jgi:hypothetical protein
MLAQADFERALAFALGEFAPAWEIVGDCAPVDPADPRHWGSGSRSFQVTLRHRVTGHLKVLGRRVADEPNASLHPAVALSPIGAYRHGNTEPIRRYLEEIGVAATAAGDAATLVRQPSLTLSPAATKAVAMEVVTVHAVASSPVVGKRKWPSLAAVTSRWRRETPRPVFAEASVTSGARTPALEPRRRVLRRLRRELAIWQWRRSAGGADL